MPNEFNEEAVQKMIKDALEQQKKELELSSANAELARLREDNEKLSVRLASVEEVQNTIDNVQDTLENQEEDGEDTTALGEILEKVVAMDEAFEELSSKFENVVSNLKTVTPMEAGIGKMSTSSEEVSEELATPEEIVSAIEVIETYMDEVGDLTDLAEEGTSEDGEEIVNPLEESSKKAKEAIKVLASFVRKKPVKTETASKDTKLQALKAQILSKKRVETSSKSTSLQLLKEKIKARSFERAKTLETSSYAGSEYGAGDLAGKMFSKKV